MKSSVTSLSAADIYPIPIQEVETRRPEENTGVREQGRSVSLQDAYCAPREFSQSTSLYMSEIGGSVTK